MSKPLPLPVWDRRCEELIEEWMDENPATYESQPTRSITQWLRSHPLYDWFIAAYQSTRQSARQIEPFIRKNHIDMSDFEPVAYRSFAEFFDRKFRPGARTFPAASHEMGAFAEARYLAWDRLEVDRQFPVKGHSLNARNILGGAERARLYLGGPVLLARLSPLDYHHVHYPDDGRTLDDDRLGRRLWTVNWRALLSKPDILFSNERHINILEKSLFKFGGSAIVVFGEPGAWRPSDDLVERTKEGIETLVRLGEVVALQTTI
jgi:phosphatidylserine decarboxylase